VIKLVRDEKPEEGLAFLAMAYGTKPLADGTPFDFDELYGKVYAPTVGECGMTAQRADRLFESSDGVLEAVWRSLQRAEVVIVDCTTRSADLALELGLAIALGKRLIVLAQHLDDVPADLRGRVRPILYQGAGLGVAALMRRLKEHLQIVRHEAITENDLLPLKSAETEPISATIVLVAKNRMVIETDDRGHRRLWELSSADTAYTPDATRP